jgi:endo-1,4-beta-mannosidase
LFLRLVAITVQGLDFVIAEANKRGVYLILSLVNNWDGYGGKKQYVQWARDQGHSMGSDDDFFTNSVTKQFYKNHIKVRKASMISIYGPCIHTLYNTCI